MSTTLSRRIRRIGLMPTLPAAEGVKPVKRFDPDITPEARAIIVAQLRHDAKERRMLREPQQPRSNYRRSKARRKATK